MRACGSGGWELGRAQGFRRYHTLSQGFPLVLQSPENQLQSAISAQSLLPKDTRTKRSLSSSCSPLGMRDASRTRYLWGDGKILSNPVNDGDHS